MAFYRDRIYPHLVQALGNPKPIAEIRRRIMSKNVNFLYLFAKVLIEAGGKYELTAQDERMRRGCTPAWSGCTSWNPKAGP